MCNKCYRTTCSGTCSGCCSDCEPSCPIKLDFGCIIYNKEGKSASTLDGLGLANGASLALVIELLDEKIKQVNALNFFLPYLRNNYVVNTLEQFAEAVDDQLSTLKTTITGINVINNLSLTATDSPTIDFTTSGTLGHTLTGSVKISANVGNLLSSEADGLMVTPQTIAVNYVTKEISISGGNTIDLTPIITAPTGFLGNVAADPVTINNGNYWYNTTDSKLKIKVGGLIREITII